jgi:hypothetical protein
MSALVHRSALLLAEPNGTLWAAHHYRYLVRRYSAAARPLLEIAVAEGEPVPRGGTDRAEARLLAKAVQQGMAVDGGARAEALPVERVFEAAARGRDGNLYLMVRCAGGGRPGPFLDRYDPAREVLERVPLRLRDGTRIASLAAGRDALYLADYRGTDGRFRIRWEDLEEAPWEPVGEARIGSPAR